MLQADFADPAQRGDPQPPGASGRAVQFGIHRQNYPRTPAARRSAASASTCSGVAGTRGSRDAGVEALQPQRAVRLRCHAAEPGLGGIQRASPVVILWPCRDVAG